MVVISGELGRVTLWHGQMVDTDHVHTIPNNGKQLGTAEITTYVDSSKTSVFKQANVVIGFLDTLIADTHVDSSKTSVF